MPPTLKKWGAYCFRLVCLFVRLSVRSKKFKARVLKFHIWIPHQKIAYPYFFSCPNNLPLPSYAPLKGKQCKFVIMISRKLLQLGASNLVSFADLDKNLKLGF